MVKWAPTSSRSRRIAALMRDRGAAFLERWFTAREIDYCSQQGGAEPSLRGTVRRQGGRRQGAADGLGRAACPGDSSRSSMIRAAFPRSACPVPILQTPRRGLGSARSRCLSRTATSTPPRSPSWPSQMIGRYQRNRGRGREAWPVNRDIVEQVLRDYDGLAPSGHRPRTGGGARRDPRSRTSSTSRCQTPRSNRPCSPTPLPWPLWLPAFGEPPDVRCLRDRQLRRSPGPDLAAPHDGRARAPRARTATGTTATGAPRWVTPGSPSSTPRAAPSLSATRTAPCG